MSVMNTDLFSRLTAIDPNYADNAASQTANSQAAFGSYLQSAQTQPVDLPPSSGGWSNLGPGDAMEPNATAAQAAPPSDSSTATSMNQDASTASPDQPSRDSQDSVDRSSQQGSRSPSDVTQDGNTNKAKKGDATAVTPDLNMVATAVANAAPITGSNPANDSKAIAGQASAKPDSAPNPPTTVNPPQTDSAVAANGQAAAEQAAAEATPAAPTLPKEKSAADTPTAEDATAHTASPKPNDKAAGIDSLATAAVAPTCPAVSPVPTPPADPKPPEHAVVSGVTTAPAGQPTESLATQANDAAATIPDAPSVQDVRTKSAAASLGQSENDSGATASKPPPSASSPTAAPQTATHGTNAAGGDSSTAAAADADLSVADRVRFVQRVEQAIQGLSDQGGSLRLRLSPPELGSLHIEISVAKGEMTARVQAETTTARNILLDNLPALRERLAQHDIKVQRFDVDLMDRSTGGMSNQSSQYQDYSRQNPGSAVVRAPFRGGSELPGTVETATFRPASEGGRLNVVV